MSREKSKATGFFETLTRRDVRLLRKRNFILMISKDLVFFLIILFLIIWNALASLRPVPVIVTNSETGQVRIVKDTLPAESVSDISVKAFMDDFINFYSTQDPDAAINLSKAYKMMTPTLAEILDSERVDAGKAEKYAGKNIKSDFYSDRISISGDRKVGGELTILGTGTMFFRPQVGFNGDYGNFRKVALFFQAKVKVFQQVVRIPYGMLIDYYKIDYFEDEELLKAFLLKAKVNFEGKGEDKSGKRSL